ncbi:MAG: DUF1643 domain-containing protein, partial [Bacteroidota bacterium]
TVFNVCNYIYKNSTNSDTLKNIGGITIVNLMPHYLTDSSLLVKHKGHLIDKKNLGIIDNWCQQISKVIVAWGNHPKGLFDEYEFLKSQVNEILKVRKNEVFYVKQLSQAGNPRHGQVWGYKDPLLSLKVES